MSAKTFLVALLAVAAALAVLGDPEPIRVTDDPSSPNSGALSPKDCIFTSRQFVSYDKAVACLTMTPFDKTKFDDSLFLLENLVPNYVFVDIALSVPPENKDIPSSVDLMGGLAKIRAKGEKGEYRNEYEWMHDLERLFLQLNDAHTMWYKSGLYSSVSFWQPFLLISFVDREGVQRIGVAPSGFPFAIKYFTDELGVDVKSYMGGVVEKINGVDAVQFLIEFAKTEVGESHDLGTRFMVSLARFHSSDTHPGDGEEDVTAVPGLFAFRPWGNIPEGKSVRYTIRKQDNEVVELEVPWVALVNPRPPANNGGDSDSAGNGNHTVADAPVSPAVQFCPAKRFQSVNEPVLTRDCGEPKYLNPWREPLLPVTTIMQPNGRLHAHAVFEAYAHDHTFLLISAGDSNNVQFFASTSDPRVGVMVLLSFSPEDQHEYLEALERGLFAFRRMNISRLIIDIRDNGGGIVCDGVALLKYFFPDMDPYDIYDIKRSPLNDELMRASYDARDIVPSPWWGGFTQEGGAPINDTSFYFDSVTKLRGNKKSEYSQFFQLDCEDIFTQFMHDHKTLPEVENYHPGSILLLSYGFCGSTCSMFARHLQLVNRVRTVVVGGIKDRAQSFTSFPGGAVIDSNTVVGVSRALRIPTLARIDPRKLPGMFRYTYLQVYGKDYREIPSEYHFVPADFRLNLTPQSAIFPQRVWTELMPIFDRK